MDGLTLALDASTYTGTVAVARDGRVVAERAVAMRGREEERLMPGVHDALAGAGAVPADLARIVCGSGPGSFTSLRVAAAIAKGIATGLSIPLFAVSSLALAGVEAGEGTWLVALDAMRGERFTAVFRWDGHLLTALSEERLLAAADLDARAGSVGARVVDGAPHARAGIRLLGSPLVRQVDLATWEPSYGRLAEAQVRWEAAHGRPLGQ